MLEIFAIIFVFAFATAVLWSLLDAWDRGIRDRDFDTHVEAAMMVANRKEQQ